jgi:Mg-chelatase subunit ChlD
MLPILAFLEAPLTALAVAAGAASLPIIIHLLNRKRFRVITWAAMRFLLAAQRKNTRRMRLEQLVLLAVRTLMVLLLVLAMASVMPWSEEVWYRLFPDSAIQAATGNWRTHKILVLDGSFSMATRMGDATAFERARRVAEQLLQESQPGDGFSVVLMAAPPRRTVPEPSDDARRVATEIEALRLPHGNADLAASLTAVEDMVRRSPSKFDGREVYFLTDMQRSTWSVRQGGDPGALLQRIQARARTIFVDVGQAGIQNSAVTSLTLGVPFVSTSADTPITGIIHNYGAEPRKQVQAELWVGKARATATEAPFGLRLVNRATVDLQPGQNIVHLPYRFTTPGDYAVQLRIDGDALDLDDARTVVVTVKENVPVMLVNGKTAVELYDQATEWLFDALNPFQKGRVPGNVSARPKKLDLREFNDAGLGDLTPYDCVFLCDVSKISEAEVQRLETHLRRGGGVIICLGPEVDLEKYNRLLYRNGDGILPARLLSPQAAPDKISFKLFADTRSKDFKVPPLNAFVGDQDWASLRAARFRQYVRAEPATRGRAHKLLSFIPEASGVNPTKAEMEAVAQLPSGDAALIEGARYRGRVVLFTSTFNMDWTTWPISPSFPALMQELLQYAVAGRLREQALTSGEMLEEYLQAGDAGLEVALLLPDGRTESVRTEAADDVGVLRWTDTDTSGIYRGIIGQHPQEHLFAVNVPTATDKQEASESDLTRTNQTELQDAYPGWEFQIVTELGQIKHSGGIGAEATTEHPLRGIGMVVARWLLLIMLVLLMVEVILAWRFGHYTAAVGAMGVPPAPGRLVPATVGVLAGLLFVLLAGVLVHAVWTGDLLGFLPDETRAGIEASLGIPAPAAGEGTRWHLEFTPYLWDAASDPWLAGGLALVLAAMVVAIYLKEGTTASPAYKLLLAGLRVFFVLLALAVLLPQIRLWFEREGYPDIALVFDDSRSMSTTDAYQDVAVREAAARLGVETGLSMPDRLQLAQALVTRNQLHWLDALLTRRRVKIHVYHCSSRAGRVADVAELHELEAAGKAIQELRADGEASQLGGAVRQVLNDFRGSSLTAIVMLTDGVTTEGEDLPKVSHYAAQMGVPLFFIGVGDAKEVRDLKLHDLQVDDTVYVNDRLVFEGRVTAQGFGEARSLALTLYEKDKDGNLKKIKDEPLTTDAQGRPVKFRLVHQPAEAGEKVYVLDLPKQEGEVDTENNRLERSVFVREAKLIKILYIEGSARYEYRFVKNLLERESDRDKRNKTMDLRVLLLDADPEYATEDKSALSDFPTKEELSGYDVVLFGDVDPKDQKLGEKNLQYLADFVKERGGGFLMIAGSNFSPHAYKDTPLRDILPIQVLAATSADGDFTTPFRPELTSVGRFHPIFRFSPDEAENTTIWNHLAELFWWSEGYRVQPAAEVLMFHPKRPASDARRMGGAETGHPLLVQQFVGSGRSMFLGIDETWRWRYREDELRFNQFWIQIVRYLSRSRQGRIELRIDRETPYRRGEPIKVTVRFPDDAPAPSADMRVQVLVTRTPLKRPGSQQTPVEIEPETLTLSKVEGSRATYEGTVSRTPEGEYRFWLKSPLLGDGKPRAEAKVLPPPGEMELLRMNQADLERAAEESHGKFYSLADADNLLDDLPAGTRVALNTPEPPRLLWNHLAVFALALGLLGCEWILRKRKHLL